MKFARAIRREVFQKYDGHCAYCGQPLMLDSFQIDHIQPFPINHRSENLNPSCRICNFFKSNLSLENFRQRVLFLVFKARFQTPHLRLLIQFELLQFNTRSVVFYFEKSDHKRYS